MSTFNAIACGVAAGTLAAFALWHTYTPKESWAFGVRIEGREEILDHNLSFEDCMRLFSTSDLGVFCVKEARKW